MFNAPKHTVYIAYQFTRNSLVRFNFLTLSLPTVVNLQLKCYDNCAQGHIIPLVNISGACQT